VFTISGLKETHLTWTTFSWGNIICVDRTRKTPVILLVDDNAVQALTRKAILVRAGFDVQTAQSAEAAFAALDQDRSNGICLVITDHIMPGESGCHFIERLWERRVGLPIMVLSGLADAEADYAGLNITFRSKPLPPDELVALATSLAVPKSQAN
jgi:DNA-binding response OmpR family regulator